MMKMSLILLGWSILTIFLTTISGGWTTVLLLLSFFVATFRRPVAAFMIILVLIPIFGNGPGRPLVPMLDGLLAVIIIQWIIEKKGHIRRNAEVSGLFLSITGLWFIFTSCQCMPAIWSLLKCGRWYESFSIVQESLQLGETSHLFTFQYFLHRSWSLCIVFFFLHRIKKRHVPLLIRSLLIGCALTVGVGIVEHFKLFPVRFEFPTHGFGFEKRLQSFFGNPGWLSEYICFLLPVVISTFFIRTTSWTARLASGVLAFWCLVTLYLCYARAGWLAAAATGCVVIIFFLYQHVKSYVKLRHMVVLVLLVCLISIMATGFFWDSIKTNRFFSKETKFGTYFSRLNLWVAAVKMFGDHPFTGIGFGTFWDKSQLYLDQSNYLNRVTHNTAHNTFLHILAEEGIAGFSMFSLLFLLSGITLLRPRDNFYQTRRGLQGCFFSLWLVILIYGMFQHLFYVHAIEVLLWIILSLPFHPDMLNMRQPGIKVVRIVRFGAAALCLVSVVVLCFRGIPYPMSYGFHKWEGWAGDPLAIFRWSKAEATVYIPDLGKNKESLIIPFRVLNPDIHTNPLDIECRLGLESVHTFRVHSTEPDFLIVPLEGEGNEFLFRLRCTRYWKPSDFGIGADFRKLGIATGPFYFLKPGDVIAEKLWRFQPILTATGRPLPGKSDFFLSDGDAWRFPPYPGMRYVWADCMNPSPHPLKLDMWYPSGLHITEILSPGTTRLHVRVFPSKGNTELLFRLSMATSDTPPSHTLNTLSVKTRFIKRTMIPLELVSHFAVAFQSQGGQ